MGVKLGYNDEQTIQPGAGATLLDIRQCTHCPRLVIHENLSPNVVLRGLARNLNCCNPKTSYNVAFEANIAVPEGGTPGEISLALSVDGYIYPLTIASVTPTVAQAYFHVSGNTNIDVDNGLSKNIAIVNASVSANPATTPAPAILAKNLNVDISRVA